MFRVGCTVLLFSNRDSFLEFWERNKIYFKVFSFALVALLIFFFVFPSYQTSRLATRHQHHYIYQPKTTCLSGNVGVPIKLLFEAEGMKVTVEVRSNILQYFSIQFMRARLCVSASGDFRFDCFGYTASSC